MLNDAHTVHYNVFQVHQTSRSVNGDQQFAHIALEGRRGSCQPKGQPPVLKVSASWSSGANNIWYPHQAVLVWVLLLLNEHLGSVWSTELPNEPDRHRHSISNPRRVFPSPTVLAELTSSVELNVWQLSDFRLIAHSQVKWACR